MKVQEPIMGFAEYNQKQYPFIYEDGILRLMPFSVDEWYQNRRDLLRSIADWGKNLHSDEWVGHLSINGTCHNGNNIIFYVVNDCSNDNGFISFSVMYFYEYITEKTDEKVIDGFFVTGREINDFYNPARAFETEIVFEDETISSTNVKIQKENEITLGRYIYQDVEVTVIISAIPTLHSCSNTPLSAQSKMKFIFSEAQNINFTIDIFAQCKKFFFYICSRTNIQFDDIQVYKIIDSTRNSEGIIRMVSDHDEEEADIKRSKKIIRYEYLREKACLLFAAIAKDTMYFEHLCSSIKATNSFEINRIVLNFVAFEREYRNLYNDDLVRSDEYNEVKNEIIQCLESLKANYTGKKRKYMKSFIKLFEKSQNKYGDRMNRALKDCEEILLPFLSYNYRDYQSEMIEEICDRMNKLRNDCAHGNIDLDISPIHLSDFSTLENLLYAMRLKSMQVEMIDIRKSIRDLRNYNVMVSERE